MFHHRLSEASLLCQAFEISRRDALRVSVAGGASRIVIPSVLSTVRTLLSWQVGFPFSSSIMNRKPVPEVMAKALCVTARLLRVAFTSSPICLAVVFIAVVYVTVREHYP